MTTSPPAKPISSDLASKDQRLLAQLLEHAFEDGWRTPDDFLRHFPAPALVKSLETANELRVQLLVKATGMHEKIALKKSIDSASEDLQLAIEEGTTSPSEILASLPTNERVRLLDPRKLWSFLTEDEFWTARAANNKAGHERAAARMAYTLESALGEDVVSLKDIADGIGFETIASSLPPPKLQAVVRHALEAGRDGSAFTEELLLEVVPLEDLVEMVDLAHTWNNVVIDKVAVPSRFIDAAHAGRSARHSERTRKSERANQSASSARPAKPQQKPPASAPPNGGGSPETEALDKIKERLAAIERLPPDAALPLTVLASIESMYADLTTTTDESEREEIVKEAFPNESMLRQAMLALIRLLDPTVDTEDPVIRDANVDALIKIVLFEERRRRELARPSAPPPAPGGRSVPPPFPKRNEPVDISLDAEMDVDS